MIKQKNPENKSNNENRERYNTRIATISVLCTIVGTILTFFGLVKINPQPVINIIHILNPGTTISITQSGNEPVIEKRILFDRTIECRLDLSQPLPAELPCNSGFLSINPVGEANLENWNNRLSRVVLPDGWNAVAYYDGYVPRSYAERYNGYAHLPRGYNYLIAPFDVFADEALTTFERKSGESELNDRVQELIIYPNGQDTMYFSENVGIDDPAQELEIMYHPQ